MGFFTRRSKWDVLLDSAGSAVTGHALQRLGRVGVGVVAGVASVIAASAAVSSARQQEQR